MPMCNVRVSWCSLHKITEAKAVSAAAIRCNLMMGGLSEQQRETPYELLVEKSLSIYVFLQYLLQIF